MKMLLTALVVATAAPAMAQNSVPADAHAGHAQKDCCKDMKDCCKEQQGKGKAACCDHDKAPAKAGTDGSPADPHAGHTPR